MKTIFTDLKRGLTMGAVALTVLAGGVAFATTFTAGNVTTGTVLSPELWNGTVVPATASTGAVHINNCEVDEAFVEFNATSHLGVCMEKAERVASTWFLADKTCKAIGKRLPDYNEWYEACPNAATLGLASMTGNLEWAQSTLSAYYDGTNHGAGSLVAGNTGCGSVDGGWVRRGDGYEGSSTFRCVH